MTTKTLKKKVESLGYKMVVFKESSLTDYWFFYKGFRFASAIVKKNIKKRNQEIWNSIFLGIEL